MTDFNDFSDIEFGENADPRCPVVLVLDASSSMAEPRPGETLTPLEHLNNGLDTLVTELNQDPLARRRVELSVVAFGTEVMPATDFATVDKITLPILEPAGITSMGRAVEVALDAIQERKKAYKANGIQYYRPQVFLITDGLPTDDVSNAKKRIADAEASKSLAFFAIGVDGADMNVLNDLAPRGALMLKGLKFDALFQWLSASQSAVSASQPGDTVGLPSPAGWAEL